MNDISQKLMFGGALAYFVSSVLPSVKSKHWWIRDWDFPRLQLGVAGLGLLALYRRYFPKSSWQRTSAFGLISAGLALDAYRIFPYTPLAPRESLPAQKKNKKNQLSILTCNVLQTNTNYSKLIDLILRKDPDIILLLEVDEAWTDACEVLEEKYPNTFKMPLSNTYGLAFYSRLPLENGKFYFLTEKDVPSLETILVLPSGERIKIFALHPKPPRPQDGSSEHRDVELIQIAKKVREETLPAVVIGDLNDVAWSHTTRLFQRLSGLLDPRIGRGPYPTFPANPPFFRFPIDHIFHDKEFRLVDVCRLEKVGSDHFPLFVRLSFEPERKEEQKSPEPEGDDWKEARETVENSDVPKTKQG